MGQEKVSCRARPKTFTQSVQQEQSQPTSYPRDPVKPQPVTARTPTPTAKEIPRRLPPFHSTRCCVILSTVSRDRQEHPSPEIESFISDSAPCRNAQAQCISSPIPLMQSWHFASPTPYFRCRCIPGPNTIKASFTIEEPGRNPRQTRHRGEDDDASEAFGASCILAVFSSNEPSSPSLLGYSSTP